MADEAKDTGVAHGETAQEQRATVLQNNKGNNMSEHQAAAGGIMEYTQDLSEAEAPPPLPVGEYPATLVRAEPKTSQASGNRYMALVFLVAPESYPADYQDGNPDGENLSYNRLVLVDTPQGRYRARKFMEALGLRPGRSIDPYELIGATCNVQIAHETYEGEPRAVITKLSAV